MTIAVLGVGVAALLAGCATDSPPQHSTRLQKAAGLKVFQIDTSKDLWEKTTDQTGRDGQDLEIKAKVKSLDNGLERIQLTGVNLANYLRVLDYMAHGGADTAGMSTFHEAESIRMYDEIAKKLDSVHKRPAADAPPPRIVVDTAFVDTKD